jgi:hypothetical protein
MRREQKVIEPHAFVLRPPIKFVIPERPERPIRMQASHRIRPALRQQTREGLPALGLDQCVVIQRSCRIDVLRCRHDVIVTGQHNGSAARHELSSMGNEAFKPGQFVIKFGPRLRVPIGKVDRSDQDSLNSCFDVAGLLILRISRQACASQYGSVVSRKNSYAVPGPVHRKHISSQRSRRSHRHRFACSLPAMRFPKG